MEDRYGRADPLRCGRRTVNDTADLVRSWRRQRGMSQARLAELAGTGQAAISRIDGIASCTASAAGFRVRRCRARTRSLPTRGR
ncbi:helix-turn-helix domain-containing protein [Streptomyces sp. NPDC002784]